jgi:hypothetical protein
MQRLLMLFVVLLVGLVPAVIRANSRQGSEQCFEGLFLDSSYDSDPDADAVLVRYQFTFPPGVYLPMRLYTATMFVQVETGQFSLELDPDQSGGQAQGTPIARWGSEEGTTAVRVYTEPADADEALIAAGETVAELNEGDKVFHDGGVYRYVNISGETATLLVTVIVPRGQYEEALEAGEDGKPLHEAICPWCELFSQFDFGEASAGPTSAKVVPSLQCGGG